MKLLGTLLKNRHSGDVHSAWNYPNLQAPDSLSISSDEFADGEGLPIVSASKMIGGKDVSPSLNWSDAPAETAQLLVVVEDIDAPTPKPSVHCVALINPLQLAKAAKLPAGALAAKSSVSGVHLLKSFIGRGYRGPSPLKGHLPHRYVFQLFALASDIDFTDAERMKPRVFLASIDKPVIARGRIIGTYER